MMKKNYTLLKHADIDYRILMLSLQQPDDTKTAGLHVALQNSIESAKFTFDRKNGEDGVGSDGASANKSLY